MNLKSSQLVFAIAVICSLLAFQNCSDFTRATTGSGVVVLSSVSSLAITPQAATLTPLATLQLNAVGGNAGTYHFSVIGTGSINQSTGLYTAGATSNDDIVRVTDSSGAAAFSFIKVANAGSPVGLTPSALLIGFQSSYQFIATGGTPPFTYSLSPAGFGSIDATAGSFTSANASGSATVTATDANGLTASASVTIQQGVATVAPVYAPNPLSFGQVATFYVSDISGGNLLLQSGPGAATGLTFSPGYQVGPANLLLVEGGLQIPVQIPLPLASGSPTCIHGKQILTYTGADQTFTPPANCQSVTIKLWGAGGQGVAPSFYGGGGGFATASILATEIQSVPTLTVIVGGGGAADPAKSSAYGGGGGPGGGGRSAIRVGNVEILTAGAGGAGGYDHPWQGDNYSIDTGVGGAGGGLVGESGSILIWEPGVPWDSSYSAETHNGGGGTQTAGGASDSASGTQFQGGTAGPGAGSGGGGYYGGGAGGHPGGISYYSFNKGGGGGGSSYIGGGGITTLTSASTVGGAGGTPGNNSDVDYISGVGTGGGSDPSDASYVAYPGGNGLVVISW